MGVRGWSRSKHHEAAAAAMATGDRLLLMMQTYLARSSQQIKARRAATWQRAIGNLFLPQYSTSSILNYRSFNFFYFKFDRSSYLKIYAKYHLFCCDLFYQYKFVKNYFNLTIFAQIF